LDHANLAGFDLGNERSGVTAKRIEIDIVTGAAEAGGAT
jgi:hypothetical protein